MPPPPPSFSLADHTPTHSLPNQKQNTRTYHRHHHRRRNTHDDRRHYRRANLTPPLPPLIVGGTLRNRTTTFNDHSRSDDPPNRHYNPLSLFPLFSLIFSPDSFSLSNTHKNMKTMDLFCASPASTAISPTINRRYRHLNDDQRARNRAPCSSLLPLEPTPCYRKSENRSAKPSKLLGRKSSVNVVDLANSPSHSSRYLLGDKLTVDFSSMDCDLNVTRKFNKSLSARLNDDSRVPKSSWARSHRRQQVVELRVSIHCKGCEGKVRKQISRIEGVTSFSIDLATKKVTVIGNVTPVDVLTSVSRVKNAQFWQSPSSSPTSSSSPFPRVGVRYHNNNGFSFRTDF